MKLNRLRGWLREHKKPVIIVSSVLSVLLIFGGVFLWLSLNNVDRTDPAASVAEAPADTSVPSPLTGVKVTPEQARRPVTAVVIENSPDARPQSGLAGGGIIFEATTEGGITRFLVLYQETFPALMGPVRSLRPYFIDWFWPFDAGVAHVGGSAQALAEARALGVKDLDQFANGSSYYRASDRFAPHNVYTTDVLLDQLNQGKGFTSSTFTSWPRKNEDPVPTPDASQISIEMSSHNYNVNYTYQPATNTYLRFVGGQPFIDRESNSQIAPKTVVVLKMDHYNRTVGSGEMFVFQDGTVKHGAWSKSSRQAQFDFKDDAGNPLQLNPGQTWVSVTGRAVGWQ